LLVDEFLAGYPLPIAMLTHALRDIVQHAVPDTFEEVKIGWKVIGLYVPIVKNKRTYYGFIAPHNDRATLGFTHGTLMRDARQMLGAEEKLSSVRYVYVRSKDDLHQAQFTQWLNEAAELARMPRAMRHML
jgi:hypothetical protein